MPDSGNLDNCLRLVWVLDPGGETAATPSLDCPNCILKPTLIHTDKCISHPSSKKLPLAADGDHFKKLQLAKMKRSITCEVPSS